ncbi:hypothetical protein M3201_16145 [Paenibacillus motobuensis]|uniref:hypothetical protein n=1 Tax=Paenibacillus TaxID=44249 RepID=UPI002040F523|nr:MULTISPECIES: hypothetical protein [Paenibacillus]MCM3041237.1 hypothetical protein [Paenibacillus lutimineralis]MCM3648341.1 hypothetical protein [Paenibacillus motobuensis]
MPDRKIHFIDANESSLSFRFRYKGKIYDSIFRISISPLTGRAWRRFFAPSPVKFLVEHKGLTFGYALPEELPEEFVENEVKFRRAIQIFEKLVDEVPMVLKSFHFINRPKFEFNRCRCLGREKRRILAKRISSRKKQ